MKEIFFYAFLLIFLIFVNFNEAQYGRGRGGYNRGGYYEGNYGYNNNYNDYGRYNGRNDADVFIRSPIGNGEFNLFRR
ncbi:heterogeneous nuclear ribonucleoprotein A3-like [Leptopilina boulardi]|uniref:heterogeneous nuclear ribonucleoprotein A3-like n=1 Tax=Leptopilina boulardi TaxID=63433 RepID=UPI0021F5DDBA|nr:heterogeneous nuclear ribonucleoprotein A3-like [Leptopilina boulardi]